MNNPDVYLREYLKNLLFNYITCKENYQQLDELFKWVNKNGYETVEQAEHFYYLVFFNFRKVLLLELYKLFSDGEKRSIVDWLCKAYDNAHSLGLVHIDPWVDDEEKSKTTINVDYYKEVIDKHKKTIDCHSHLIKNLKSLRDKSFAHADKEFFPENADVDKYFPIKWSEIESLIKCADKILTTHYEFLFNTEYSTDVLSGGGIESVLKSSRAFSRIRKSKKLLNSGFKPWDYLNDNYEENEGEGV